VSSSRLERGSTGDLDVEAEAEGPDGMAMAPAEDDCAGGGGDGSAPDDRTIDEAVENNQSRKEESKSAPTTVRHFSLEPCYWL
jgi:hypothetical protein